MNYAPYVINYLSTKEDIAEIYLVPKAFISERKGNRLIKISDTLLTPDALCFLFWSSEYRKV